MNDFGTVLEFARLAALAALLLAATVIDVRTRRIPNALVLAGCIVGLVLAATVAGWAGFIDAGKGLLMAFAIGLPFWLLGWMGAGDVKLVAAVGAFVGSSLVTEMLLASGVAGIFLVVGALAWNGVLAQTGERMLATIGLSLSARRMAYVAPGERERDVRLPYAVAISAGTLAAIVMFG